jgi:hypothetical protein
MRSRKARTQLRQQIKTHGGDKRQSQPPHLARRRGARLGRQRLRARQQVAHLRQQCRARGRERTLRLVRSNRRTPSRRLQSGDGLGQRRLGHVQAQGGAAKVQFFGHGHELAPQAAIRSGLHAMASFICRSTY